MITDIQVLKQRGDFKGHKGDSQTNQYRHTDNKVISQAALQFFKIKKLD
jgi:hypothetical protein